MSALSSSIQFDAGFTPEYILAMNTASDGISYFDLYNMTTNSNQYLGSSVSNPDLSYTSAGSVINTGQGYEFSFPLTALGNPTGEIGLFTMLVNDPGSNSNPTLVSNQFLTPADNGALSYGTGSIDFGAATPDPIHYIIADNNCYAEDCLILDVPSSLTLPNIPDQCVNASSAPVLNTTISGISGTWSPSAIDVSAPVVGAIYSFTPNAGACAVGGSITVDVNAPAVPVFSIANQYCQGDLAPALPNSDGTISGTWSPSIIATSAAAAVSPIDYVFTPTTGQCASDFTLSVNVTPSQIPTFSFLTSLCQMQPLPIYP